MLGNQLAIRMFFYSKNPIFFASTCPPVPFLKVKLTRSNQLIDCSIIGKYLSQNKKLRLYVGLCKAMIVYGESVLKINLLWC